MTIKMKIKTFSLLSLSILVLVMLISFGSAVASSVFSITDVNAPTSVSEDAGSFTFTFNLTYTGTSENMNISFNDSTTSIGDISIPTATGMNGSISESRIITGTISNFANQGGNTINITVNATTTGGSRDDETIFSVLILESQEFNFCEYDSGVSENPGELKVRIKDITVEKGFGDDNEWLLLDEVEVEIEVENRGNYDVDDIEVEWGLYNVDDDEWAIEIDDVDDFNLKDGDEEKLTITFRIDDDDFDLDLDELGKEYTLYVRATGEVSDRDSSHDGDLTCASDSEKITIEQESDFVILTDIEFPELVQCGAEVQITADVWNIGDDDQDDVSVVIYNKELGIDEKIEIGDIDAFENEKLNALVRIPKDAEEKWHTLKFIVYDEDHDVYESDYDDDESIFNVPIKVEGGRVVEAQALISASLESEAKAGQELVIKAIITNTGSKSATYVLDVAGYTSWASSAELDKNKLTLNAGESAEVLITLNTNKDASGEKFFDIVLTPAGGEELKQPVSVFIEKSGFDLRGIISESNWYLWLIAALNAVLVIIIIVVAVRIARK